MTPDETKVPGGRTIPFFTVLFPMLTAVITFIGTLAGIWWPTNEDRNELAEEASALDQQVGNLSVELDAQQQVNLDLEDEVATQAATITSLQERLDQSSSPPSASAPSGGPTPVYRETGDQPLRFNEGYGVDLDTLDDDWGIGRIFGTLDLYLDTSSEGLRLSTPPGVVALMDGEATYQDCDRATDLQQRLSTGETAAGTQFCLRTNGKRWAFVTILEVERVEEAIILDIIVWAPND